MTIEERQTVEDVLGDFGFRARWRASKYRAEVEVFQILGKEQDGTALFELKGSGTAAMDAIPDIANAEPYLEGSIKWDGCSHLDLRETHFCGPGSYQDHVDLMRYLYIRAFELMDRKPEDVWEEAEANKAKWEPAVTAAAR